MKFNEEKYLFKKIFNKNIIITSFNYFKTFLFLFIF